MADVPLLERIQAALEDPDPVSRLQTIIAAERARELRLTAEHLRNIGRRCHGAPGDRVRRHTANECAELLIRRNREISRAALDAEHRRRREAQTTDTSQETRP